MTTNTNTATVTINHANKQRVIDEIKANGARTRNDLVAAGIEYPGRHCRDMVASGILTVQRDGRECFYDLAEGMASATFVVEAKRVARADRAEGTTTTRTRGVKVAPVDIRTAHGSITVELAYVIRDATGAVHAVKFDLATAEAILAAMNAPEAAPTTEGTVINPEESAAIKAHSDASWEAVKAQKQAMAEAMHRALYPEAEATPAAAPLDVVVGEAFVNAAEAKARKSVKPGSLVKKAKDDHVKILGVTLTKACADLFREYAADAGNWSDMPPLGANVDSTKANRGHITALKKAGLIVTDKDDGHVWVMFTVKGAEVAKAMGYTVQALARE